MFKNLILHLKQLNSIPYLSELCEEMEKNQVLVGSELSLTEASAEESLLICDTKAAALWAKKLQIGYLVYAHEGKMPDSFPDCLCVIEGFDEVDYEFILHMYERSRKIPWTILATKRCIVREIMEADVDRLYEIYEDSSITRYMEGLYAKREEELEFTRAYIKYMYGFYGYGMWIVEEKATGMVIGRAGISHREGFENLEIGYLIDASYQHKGYAAEVCRAIIQYAGKRLGCERLNAFIQKENEISIHMILRLGFEWKEEVRIEQKLMQRFEYVYKNFTN